MSATETPPNARLMTISETMAGALLLECSDVTRGNVASHAIRVTYAHDQDPFAGMNIGWVDETESVLSFLCGIVDDVDKLVQEGTWTEDSSYEIAEQASEMPTRSVFELAAALHEYLEDPQEIGAQGDAEAQVSAALYLTASRIADTLALRMAEAAEHDDEEEGE